MSTGIRRRPLRLAYLVSRFPKATETFILNEILELESLGHHVELFPLVLEDESVVQPGAAALAARAHDMRPWRRDVLAAQIYWLRRRPRAYLGVWLGAMRGTIRAPKFLVRALAAVPAGAAVGRAVAQMDIDHIHAHWATHATLAAWVASRLSGRPYSFTAHAHDIYVERAMLGEKIRAARFVVTISDVNRRLLAGWYGAAAEAKTVVIHCGVDPAIFAPLDGESNRTSAGSEVDSNTQTGSPDGTAGRVAAIVCVASLQQQKGQHVLVEACRMLIDRGWTLRCTLVGEGDERSAIEARIVALGLSSVVVLAGSQPRDRVVAIVRSADVVVQPSVILPNGKTEGIPVALMEALAAERAVVASNVSGIPELVIDGETGLLVAAGDSKDLADAIERLLRDPERRSTLGRAGRERVLRDFNLHRTTAELADRFSASLGDGAP